MTMQEDLEDLEPFVGRWSMTPSFAEGADDAPRALTTFEWLPGRRFLIQRWEVDHPDAPDGIAIIGRHPDRPTYIQNYFDSRGVARVYDMDVSDGEWTLERLAEHPDFSQRFIGRFDEAGHLIIGSWETSNDQGSNWSLDFGLTYTKLG